ncbi:MAG: EAL domain-containing response regulator [Desulfobulbaceae bacterium]|jgi:EAL domain-containing protein (putative c-di-GMP-specific phosphodiesterase class I)/ActR/RegA family two-component response regulator|nr:EAL domain-containing response regulator [Desulfobulbaceae bacterium]
MKILIIDDEPFILKLLHRQIGSLTDLEVVPCESAHAALAELAADAAQISLIFCDLQMPEMDGIEFVRQLVALHYDKGLVLVSGEDTRTLETAEKLALAHKLQLLGTIHKPAALEQLQQMLERGANICTPAPPRAVGKIYSAEDLRQAIAAGHLENYYQPKGELATGTVFGVESLVRWRHPEDGLVFPDQFITLAEEHGLIDDLTRVVLTAALAQTRQWLDAGLDLKVAVNASMDNFSDVEFPDFIARTAEKAGVPLTNLILEITESRLMQDPVSALDIIIRLRLKRIRLSIDDFGTGNSSMAQLRDLPFDELKIDRGFVHGAWRNDALRTIFEASLSIAQQLGMKTVAEGPEDRDDWDFLKASGCDLAQGYFIAKPMPGPEVLDWIAAWESRRQELIEG